MKFFGNVTRLESEINAVEQALQPDLEKANITTALREGKVIPIGEATISEKYQALRAAHPPGTDLQERANLLQNNDRVSKELEKVSTDLAVSQTSVGTLTREKASLQEQLTAAQASVTSLTAKNADLNNQLQAAVNQYSASQKALESVNTEISRKALEYGALSALTGPDDKPLAADASAEARLEAANRIPAAEKLTAIGGAVNRAMTELGVNVSKLPNGSGTLSATAPAKPDFSHLKGLERAAAAHKAAQGK